MKIDILADNNRKLIIVAIIALIVVVPFGYSVVSAFICAEGASDRPFLEMPDEKYKKCVRETDYMRFRHMDLLKEIREDYVRQGKQGEIRLSNCRECHIKREQFCDKCHNAVNLHLNCFECHYFPESDSKSKH